MLTEWREDISAFKILTSKPTGKRLLGRPRRRWKDKTKIDFKFKCRDKELD